MDKITKIRNLDGGRGVQFLLDAADEIFDNPIVMFDTNYSLVAYTDELPDDPLWSELLATGTFSMETQMFFAREYFTEDTANASKMVVLKSPKLKYDRILAYIFNADDIKVASILMCSRTPFVEGDSEAFELLASKVSSAIHDDDYYNAYGFDYYEDKICKLLDGIIKEPVIYTPHIQILYNGFEDYLYVAVVDASRYDAGGDKLAFLKSALKETFGSFKLAVYSGYIVMIMSSINPVFDEKIFINLADDPFERYDLYAGISTKFENLYEVREYYDRALAVLKSGAVPGAKRVFVDAGH